MNRMAVECAYCNKRGSADKPLAEQIEKQVLNAHSSNRIRSDKKYIGFKDCCDLPCTCSM